MIKTKKDAKSFIEKIKNGKDFHFYNENIDMLGHGTTEYSWENRYFSSYNFGSGWEDQVIAYFTEEDFLEKIWDERHYINKAIESGKARFIQRP